jgi:quinol monooxygenase YgiN
VQARVAHLLANFDRNRGICVYYSAYVEPSTLASGVPGCLANPGKTQQTEGVMTMGRYALDNTTVSEAVAGGGLLVVAQWEAKDGEADRVANILARFLPEAQREDGAKLFLISRAKDNPAQFLFYELFRDEAAFKAHQESAHFKTYIAGQALPLLARRERAQYALL